MNFCFIISVENFCLTLQQIFPKITNLHTKKRVEKFYKCKLQEDIKVRNDIFQKKKIAVNFISTQFVDTFDYVYFYDLMFDLL